MMFQNPPNPLLNRAAQLDQSLRVEANHTIGQPPAEAHRALKRFRLLLQLRARVVGLTTFRRQIGFGRGLRVFMYV